MTTNYLGFYGIQILQFARAMLWFFGLLSLQFDWALFVAWLWSDQSLQISFSFLFNLSIRSCWYMYISVPCPMNLHIAHDDLLQFHWRMYEFTDVWKCLYNYDMFHFSVWSYVLKKACITSSGRYWRIIFLPIFESM